MKPKILSIRIEHKPDESPDLSHLREYRDSIPNGETVYIDRQARGEQGRNEYRYFILGCGDAEYIEQDYARYEAYNRGDWQMLGVIAKAVVQMSGDLTQTIHSGGLWGVESDSGEYFNEIAKEELASLRLELEAIGFGKRAIDHAFKSVETP